MVWLGIVTFVAGCMLWYWSRRGARRVPVAVGRMGLGAAALGLGTMTMLQRGLWWMIASICFSAVAIVLIASVLWEIRRR